MNNRERAVLTEFTDNDLYCDEYRLEKLEKIQKWAGKNKFLIVDGVTSSDCFQGNVGSCVIIAGIQALAQKPELIERILLTPNGLSRHSKNVSIRQLNGVFRCNFGGKIVETSTKLPVNKFDHELLGCADSAEADELGRLELWPVYLEKCFAQHFCRGYDELMNGFLDLSTFMKSVLLDCRSKRMSSARNMNTYRVVLQKRYRNSKKLSFHGSDFLLLKNDPKTRKISKIWDFQKPFLPKLDHLETF